MCILFVDLPNVAIRKQIFAIHLEKRQVSTAEVNLDEVAEMCDGFSGAEIEQVVVSSLYTIRAEEDEVNTQYLIDEIKATRPLSVVMAEQIDRLREWASDRTVPVD